MNPLMLAMPEWLEQTLAGALIMTTLYLLVHFVRGVVKNNSTQGSLDERILNQLAERDATIAALEARNETLNDRLADMMGKAIALATTHGEQIMQAVDQVRIENREAIRRLHAKQDVTHEALQACTRHHEECQERVSALEARMRGERARGVDANATANK